MIYRLQAAPDMMSLALDAARQFTREYPDRTGQRDCCVYTFDVFNRDVSFVCHRTPGRVVVARQDPK